MTLPAAAPFPPRRSRAELIADDSVHVIGLIAGTSAALALLIIVTMRGRPIEITATAVYAAGLLAMLGCSAAYNMARNSRWRGWLRRFDHAAIFAMIAGTYTPFTLLRLDTAWATGLMTTVWSVAGIGILGKLVKPAWLERLSIPLYLALGWTVVVAIEPLRAALGPVTLALLAGGGILYTVGVAFHVWERLPFQNALWHGFVLAAAGTHYAAVITGVILSPAA
ncbi:PAQR family membrane homeostasis protein TrhA [Desertibaculum subflavum]|uniref:PAQR family membrane homeostasis protein TrhA n=1 Tax=Desertibaculum subflavum TaxID=2268458 RepID=UPI000E66CE10